MTSRERWIVYPLVFLSLGLIFKLKMQVDPSRVSTFNTVRCEQIVSDNIHVVDDDRRPHIVMSVEKMKADQSTSDSKKLGRIVFFDENGAGKNQNLIAMIGNRNGVDGFVFLKEPSTKIELELLDSLKRLEKMILSR